MKEIETHLDVYNNRSELHTGDSITVYLEGRQDKNAQSRYRKITDALENGFLEDVYSKCLLFDYTKLNQDTKDLLASLVKGVSENCGRAIVALTFAQLTIKSICPDQCVRLHKGSTRRGSFSWQEGVSIRTLDSNYFTPFLRKYELISLNAFGFMMTRSLAENYPYSKVYKADMQGPIKEWLDVVDLIEDNAVDSFAALNYLTTLLINRSNRFEEKATIAMEMAATINISSLDKAERLLSQFFTDTKYSARAFEVVIHSFMQAFSELGYTDLSLIPLSQMRSANKKHHNIGDIEMAEGSIIIEAWDAKYGKTYLYEELGELEDKLLAKPGANVAGFIVDKNLEMKEEIIERSNSVSVLTGVEIKLFNFTDWIDYKTEDLSEDEKKALANKWVIDTIESFSRRRTDIAPIDEPCDGWLTDLISLIDNAHKSLF